MRGKCILLSSVAVTNGCCVTNLLLRHEFVVMVMPKERAVDDNGFRVDGVAPHGNLGVLVIVAVSL